MSTHPIIKALQEELAKELKGLVKTHIEDYQIAVPSRLRDSEHETRNYITMTNSFCAGHEAATERLMGLLEKAVEMAEFYAKARYNGYQASAEEDGGKRARQFLTTLADASGENFKPGHYTIDAESFDKIIDDLDKEPSEAVKKAREKFLQLKKEAGDE